jgi:hypothetical protein
MMGAEQRIRASSSTSTTLKNHTPASQRRKSIQNVRQRRYNNLGKIYINDNNDENFSPPLSPPPMSHERRTSTVFREILLGNLRVEDVTFVDKASSTAATFGSSISTTSIADFNQFETSSVASTSTNLSEPKHPVFKQQIVTPKVIKPQLQRNDSITSTSTTTSTLSFFKSFFLKASRGTTTSQNSQASSECGVPGRRKSSVARVIDEEQEDQGEEKDEKSSDNIEKKYSNEVGVVKDVAKGLFIFKKF